MKKLMRTFALMAVAALGLSACTGEKLVPDNGNADEKFVTVHFGAEAAIEGATKATLTTEDEKTFKSAWENGDVLSVEYSNDNTPVNKGIVPATWTADHFDAKLPKYNGTWDYNVVYPAPDAESKVDFGSARTQKGNAYNSKYDLMKGSATAEGADAGMTADRKNVVFNMTRQTAIAYFHLTSTLDEEVVSAKLSVEGGNIASSLVKVSGTDYSKGFDLSLEDLNEITITFTEAPTAKDMRLWFNVLPTTYTKMTLTVETANHTLTISRTAADNYAAGKLYKVVKNTADKWVKKVTANDGSLEHPYTAAEAIAVIDASPNPSEGVTNQHVKGIVKAAPSFDARFSSLSYDIVSGEATLYIYSGRDLGNADFVGAEDLKVGDEVVVLGTLKKYTNAGVVKYELDKTNYLISINGETQIYRGLAVSGQKTAFTVGDTFELGGKVLQVWRGKENVDVTASATFSGYDMSTEGKQTVTVTVGAETVTYEINVCAAGGETPKTYTLQFGKNYNDSNAGGYTKTWEATRDGFTWTMVNWNNNNNYNNNWTFVKAGSNKAASVATITTNTTMPEAISTITMTIDAINATYVNSIKLEVLSADGKTVKETISGTAKQGDCVFNITNPQKDCKYKITVDCKRMTGKNPKNGFVQVSKVVYTN